MAVTLVQWKAGFNGVTLDSPPTPGNTLLLWKTDRNPTFTTEPTLQTGFTSIARVSHFASFRRSGRMQYRVVQSGDTAAIASSSMSSSDNRYVLMEWAGVIDVSVPADDHAATTALDCGGSITPTAGVDCVIVGGAAIGNSDLNNPHVTPGAGVTELDDTDHGGSFPSPDCWVGYKQVSSPSGSYTVGGTINISTKFSGVTVALTGIVPLVPDAEFTADVLSGDAPLSVDFTDLSTNTPTSWLWDFGDGATSTSQNPTHVYTTPGTYTVELTATNANGSGTETKTAYISVLPTSPGAVLLDIFDTTSGVAVYQGTVTDATNKKFQAQHNGDGIIEFKVNRNSPNAALVQADRLVKIRIPQIHSDHIFSGFIDAPTATVISTDEQGGEFLNVVGRGALSYWGNAIWLSYGFVLPWWTCTDDPPVEARGQVEVKANGGPQAGGKYRIYHITAGVIDASDPYEEVTVSSDDCWYFDARKTYLWPSENNRRFLVHLLTGPYAGDYFHPHQDGVTETLRTIAIGDTIELSSLAASPGAVLKYMFDDAAGASRPTNPLPLMTVDFTDTLDSDGNAWTTTDALTGMTVGVGDQYLDTVGKLLATGVIDVEMGPDLDMHAYNAPHGRDLTGAAFGSGVVRFVKGTGDGTGNIADKLDRQARDVQVATFTEVLGTDDASVQVELPDTTGRVPREVSIRGDTNDETALSALGLADLEQRLAHAEAVGFNLALGNDESTGRYLPGPDYSDNGHFWVGDTVRLHTGSGAHDFDEVDVLVAAITLDEDDGGNLRCTVEVGTGLGPRQRGRYGSGLAQSPGSTGAAGQFVSRSSEGPVGAVEVGTGITDHGDLTGLADDDHTQYVRKTEGGQETINPIGTTGAAEDIDPTLGNVVTATLGDDTVFTLLEPVGAADATLVLWVDAGAGGFTPTFDADGGAFVWNGTTPTLPTAAGDVYRVILERIPATTNDWVGDLVGDGGGGAPATTVEAETTFGIASAVGTDTEYARQDHTHGSPANPVTEAAVRDIGRWEPVTDGDVVATELIFEDGDVVVAWVPG